MLNEWVTGRYLKNNDKLLNLFTNNKPFPHLVLKDFFDQKKINNILFYLEKEEFIYKNTDLFQFKQTKLDINSSEIKELKSFYDFFTSEEFGKFISKITGLNIKLGKADMSGFIYSKTDYLLPHDDRLEGRKIAYVLNLSKNFKKSDGGKLQLFNIKNKKPFKIVKSYVPNLNTLILFEVSEASFHQVEEVLNYKDRISFAGWFYEY